MINAPEFLRSKTIWLIWKLAYRIDSPKPTKIPFNARSKNPASVTNSADYSSFDQAWEAYSNDTENFSGIGFVLREIDNLICLDIDAPETPQEKERANDYINRLDTYAEISPSGNGLHIIGRGSIPTARKTKTFELYHRDRYMTFTGKQFGTCAEINDCDAEFNEIYSEIAGTKNYTREFVAGDFAPKDDDDIILQRASRANNGELFELLYSGNWNSKYNSQSEADFALIDIIAFYTKNRMQIERLFKASQLGKREKAQRVNYIAGMISSAFDRDIPIDAVDISEIMASAKKAFNPPVDASEPVAIFAKATPAVADNSDASGSQPSQKKPIAPDYVGLHPKAWRTPPDGLIGGVARYIFDTSPKPIYEVALCGALGLLAGIAGRQFTVLNSGLNLYLMMLAQTGLGKEAMANGMSRIVGALQSGIAVTDMQSADAINHAGDIIGPSEFASMQGAMRDLQRPNPCYVSVLGEIGERLGSMSSANINDQKLLRFLLDVYGKNQKGAILGQSIYADKEKNVKKVIQPAITILGEGVPSTFYDQVTHETISKGLIPRFIICEYTGPRIALKIVDSANFAPPIKLIKNLGELIINNHKLLDQKTHVDIEFCDGLLNRHLTASNWLDTLINTEFKAQIYSRAGMNVLKIAGLLAVSQNSYNPTMTHEMYDWALSFVWQSCQRLIEKEELGKIKLSNTQTDYSDYRGVEKEMAAVLRNMFKNSKQGSLLKEFALFTQHEIIMGMEKNNSNYGFKKITSVIGSWMEIGYVRKINNAEWKEISTKSGKGGKGGFQIIDFDFLK